MRNWTAILALIATASLAGPPAHGEDQHLLARIRVDMQMVSVSVPQALQLAPALKDRKTAPAAWIGLQKMLKDGKATLIDWPVVWLQNGIRSAAESVVEYRYATEPTPPQGGGGFIDEWWHSPTWGPFTPSAFETRNVGATLEVEGSVDPGGQVIDLDFVSSNLRFAGFRQWRGQESPLGYSGIQQQPEFQSAKVTTHIQVCRDEPVLAGVFVFAEPQPHVELHILHVRWTLLPPSTPTFSNNP